MRAGAHISRTFHSADIAEGKRDSSEALVSPSSRRRRWG
jgi:hypothetical protein